jgi:hypothetical protein
MIFKMETFRIQFIKKICRLICNNKKIKYINNLVFHFPRIMLCFVIEGKIEERIEVTVRRGLRRKQLLDDLKEMRGYWKLKEEALDRTLWRTRFGRGYGPVVRQTAE